MIHDFKGPYTYSETVVSDWNFDAIGVYYCGTRTTDGKLTPLYIGKGTGEGGIRSRLLDHLSEDNWLDVTHFGYHICDTTAEAEDYEMEEIDKYKPKCNKVGK